jgi:phenylpropionate dioxygenase-like ring-hydroxylating dioxygenase large terminal subunit
VTPVDEAECILWMRIALNFGHDIPDQELLARQDQITSQDRPIVEGQRPARLPLDLQAELHVRSDKFAVAYRRWLRDLGIT